MSISTPWVVGVMEALRYLPCLPVKYLGPMRISELIAVRLPNSQLLGPHQNWNHPLLKWGHSLGRAHYHALSVSPRDINFESTSTPNAMTSKSHGVKDSMARLLGRKSLPRANHVRTQRGNVSCLVKGVHIPRVFRSKCNYPGRR